MQICEQIFTKEFEFSPLMSVIFKYGLCLETYYRLSIEEINAILETNLLR